MSYIKLLLSVKTPHLQSKYSLKKYISFRNAPFKRIDLGNTQIPAHITLHHAVQIVTFLPFHRT